VRYQDLRGFMALLEEEGELRRVRRPVSTKFEIAAGIRRMGDTGGPALLFEDVLEHDIPVVGGLFSTRHRALLAMGAADHQEGNARFLRGLHQPIAPVATGEAPCQEVVHTGDEVDLDRLPLPVYSAKDGGAYVTVGLTISNDPLDGRRNASVYREMRVDRQRLAVMSHAFQGLGTQIARAAELGVPLEVAIANGVHPVLLYASQAKVPHGVDELAIAGGILGRPVPVVRCRTVGLEVPADAEIVIEGRILPGEYVREGPFGEFTGYYGPAESNPVIQVTAITHRRDPVFLAGLTGVPTTDNHVLKVFAYESNLLQNLRGVFPEVTAVCFPDWGGVQYVAVVALAQRYKGQARHLILTALGDPARLKWVVVVDDDIDVYDTEQVNWAITTRSQPAEDLVVIPRVAGGPLDPSAPEKEVISVWGLDATRPFGAEFPEVARVPGAESFRLDEPADGGPASAASNPAAGGPAAGTAGPSAAGGAG
jgi:4-hydroxy-3-polyprenylbenzoate decarboxylase/2,5-furandicarboxylate decarboxylase 1